ncbi:MAG: PIG-L deacetylase family protein [Armatimonadota bacterium]|nr:PIG-L deacetylase family protein [Armatimonadota bacterium]
MVDHEAFWARQRLLVIAPHPDDEAYGCAGTMAKVKALGGQVYVLVGSVGDLQHYGNGPVAAETRLAELDRAMEVLRVDDYDVLFTDSDRHLRLDAVPQRDLMALIERDSRCSLDRVRPTAVLLPTPAFNQDHDALFRAGFAACRPHLRQHKSCADLVLSYESPHVAWAPQTLRPTLYVDISAYLTVKLQALSCHASQVRPAPDWGSRENVERLARLRGAEVAVDAAEAFVCHRVVL